PLRRDLPTASASLTGRRVQARASWQFPGPVPRELLSRAPAAIAARQCPLQGGPLPRLFGTDFGGNAACAQVFRGNGQVMGLVERVQRQPQAETLRQRNLFLDRFAVVNFVTHVLGQQIFRLVFRQQMAAIGGGVYEDVVRRRRE